MKSMELATTKWNKEEAKFERKDDESFLLIYFHHMYIIMEHAQPY